MARIDVATTNWPQLKTLEIDELQVLWLKVFGPPLSTGPWTLINNQNNIKYFAIS